MAASVGGVGVTKGSLNVVVNVDPWWIFVLSAVIITVVLLID